MNNGLFGAPMQMAALQETGMRQEAPPAQFPQAGAPGQFPQEGAPAQFPQEGRPAEYPQEGRPAISYLGDPLIDKYIHSFIGTV